MLQFWNQSSHPLLKFFFKRGDQVCTQYSVQFSSAGHLLDGVTTVCKHCQRRRSTADGPVSPFVEVFRSQDHLLPGSESSRCGTFVPTNEYSKEGKFQQMCIPTCTELSLSCHHKSSKKCMNRIIWSCYTIYHH